MLRKAMLVHASSWLVVGLTMLVTPSVRPVEAQLRWYRGATHTHTNLASPDVVVRWYREHYFHFVSVTDVNRVTPVAGLNAVFSAPGRFLVLSGVEVSRAVGKKLVDVNGLAVTNDVVSGGGANVLEVLRDSSRAIRQAGGLPLIDHPNLTWALTAEDIASSGIRHFEIWNAEPGMHNSGGGGSPSTEEIWDHVLSQGQLLYGIASDDSHDFHGDFTPFKANPGRAWIMVRANELTREALIEAIDGGDFYSTTGVEFLDLATDSAGISIDLPESVYEFDWLESTDNPTRYRTYFIGRGGEVLAMDESTRPKYVFQGDELYVRARVEDSSGAVAWTQPVFREQPNR